MMLFQSKLIQLDLTKYNVNLNEKNSFFVDSLNQNYSLPFTVNLNKELREKFDLIFERNIVSAKSIIKGKLITHRKYFNAFLEVIDYNDTSAELVIKYGSEILSVYETKIKDFPWPKIITQNLTQLAKSKMDLEWPETQFVFPKVFYPELTKGSIYDKYLGFVNNFEGTDYLSNEIIQENDGEGGLVDVYYNRNVMAPFPYLLEILKFGFEQTGKRVIGDVFLQEDIKKAVYIPKTYLEKLDQSEFFQFSFTQRTSAETINNRLSNVYENTFVTSKVGIYKLKFSVNMPPGIAQNFNLEIFRVDALSQELTLVKEISSASTRVDVDEELNLEIESSNNYDSVLIRLSIDYTQVDISSFNNFEFTFQDGQLNVFPNIFSLSEFVPDLKFGEFVSTLKNWLNLDIEVEENYVKIDRIENKFLNQQTTNLEHLETRDAQFKNNSNRVYRLTYQNGEKVIVSKEGQIYSDLALTEKEVIDLDSDVQPALVESNRNVITAVAPEDRSKLDFCIYNGTVSGIPVCDINVANLLSQQNVKDKYWTKWLRFRINSKTIEETFKASVYEDFNVEEFIYKFKEKIMLKSIEKRVKDDLINVTIEGETL